jgi:hypothetical protein
MTCTSTPRAKPRPTTRPTVALRFGLLLDHVGPLSDRREQGPGDKLVSDDAKSLSNKLLVHPDEYKEFVGEGLRIVRDELVAWTLLTAVGQRSAVVAGGKNGEDARIAYSAGPR